MDLQSRVAGEDFEADLTGRVASSCRLKKVLNYFREWGDKGNLVSLPFIDYQVALHQITLISILIVTNNSNSRLVPASPGGAPAAPAGKGSPSGLKVGLPKEAAVGGG